MTEPEVRVYKGIVNPFGGPWWRHPISWWKMRHFRADVKALEDSSPFGKYMAEKMREQEDDAFLYGTGDSLNCGLHTREDTR